MPRALILVLDSVGIGGAPDARLYGDEGSDTLGHIAEACALGAADRAELRSGSLQIPNLMRYGLAHAYQLANGRFPRGLQPSGDAEALYGSAAEMSKGKDTPSGHWEIAGVPVRSDWGYFPRRVPCFPEPLVAELRRRAGVPGILGNCHAAGTEIIAALGEAHIGTGAPICYTSADSVFQIAAHEAAFGLERLYRVCAIARELVDKYNVGRVIARPFVGSGRHDFQRTGNRRDFATTPPSSTLLDRATAARRDVVTIGKIADIFAHSGTGRVVKGEGNQALFDRTIDAVTTLSDGGLLFANFVDFDMLYGHRRDLPGYAAALEAFDRRLPELTGRLQKDDLLIITADHGCDPSWAGTDHTREQVPVLAIRPGAAAGSIGARTTFADIAASCAAHLGLAAGGEGTSFLPPG